MFAKGKNNAEFDLRGVNIFVDDSAKTVPFEKRKSCFHICNSDIL